MPPEPSAWACCSSGPARWKTPSRPTAGRMNAASPPARFAEASSSKSGGSWRRPRRPISAQLSGGESAPRATPAFGETPDRAAAEERYRPASEEQAATEPGLLGGDPHAAEQTNRDADEQGDGSAAFNLGGRLAEQGDLSGAE